MNRHRARARSVVVATAILMAASSMPITDSCVAEGFHPSMVFRDESIQRVLISPSGEWIVALVLYEQRFGISAQRRGDAVAFPVHISPEPVIALDWISDDDLLLTLGGPDGGSNRGAALLHFHLEGQAVKADVVKVMRPGALVDALIEEPGVVLWGVGDQEYSWVRRVPIELLRNPRGGKKEAVRGTPSAEEVARVRGLVVHWVTDKTGAVRAYQMLRWRSGWWISVGYRRDESSAWHTIWEARSFAEDDFDPQGFTSDGQRLIVTAHAGRNTRGLHEFDPESREFGKALFVHPEVDVERALLDPFSKEVIAAAYAKGGVIRFEYLGDYGDEHLAGLESRVGGETVQVASSSRDAQYLVLLGFGPSNPGTYYYHAKNSGTWVKLADAVLGVTADRLLPMRPILATSKDGTRIEGFLTLPSRADPQARAPLLVLPHGGPIGIADGNQFDALVQYIALSGIAVLQVNYRGSSGYGKEFQEAGLQQWGRQIEDDVDVVVQATIDDGHVDPDRMCIAGGSYGGFSALISVIRFPGRYRCASTIAGVTDVPLMFEGSDWSMSEVHREQMETIVGDPDADFDRMVAVSPVYRAREIPVPILIAFGSRDERVDPEHAYRLRAMLDAYDKPYEWLEMKGGSHSPTQAEMARYGRALRNFLQRHLEASVLHTAER